MTETEKQHKNWKSVKNVKLKKPENCSEVIFMTKYQNTVFLTKTSFFDQIFPKTLLIS